MSSEANPERSFAGPRKVPGEELAVAARVFLYLSWLRSVGRVQQALATRFPTEDSWLAQLNDPTFRQEVLQFKSVLDLMRMSTELGERPDIEALEAAGSVYYDSGLDALRATAERLGVDAEDLVVTLVHA
jgi:hypothetical protein